MFYLVEFHSMQIIPLLQRPLSGWVLDQWKHVLGWKTSSVVCLLVPALRACMGVNGGLRMQHCSQTRWPQRMRLRFKDMEISVVIHDRQSFTLHASLFHFQSNHAALCTRQNIYTFLSTGAKWALKSIQLSICQIMRETQRMIITVFRHSSFNMQQIGHTVCYDILLWSI